MEALCRYRSSLFSTINPHLRKAMVSICSPLHPVKSFPGVNSFPCIKRLAGLMFRHRQLICTAQCPSKQQRFVALQNRHGVTIHGLCTASRPGQTSLLRHIHSSYKRQYKSNNGNKNWQKHRSSVIYPAVGLASAAVCLAPDSGDEKSYFGVLAHEIESAIEDLKNLLYFHTYGESCEPNPSLDGWTMVWEGPSITIWSRPMDGINEYKIKGSCEDIPAIVFFFIQMDILHRKTWDSCTDEVKVFETEDDGTDLVYWRVHFPRLMAKRDYVFARRYLVDMERNVLVLLNRAVEHTAYPESRQYVRVSNYASKMVVQPHGSFLEDGFDYVMTYHDDTKMKMPAYAYNQLVKTNLPKFMDSVRSEAKVLYRRYTEILNSGGNFERADSKIQALHSLMLEARVSIATESHDHQAAETSVSEETSAGSKSEVIENSSQMNHAVSLDEMTTNNEIQLLKRLKRIPMRKITPPQYLPDIKQFAITLLTEGRVTPLQFKQVRPGNHSDQSVMGPNSTHQYPNYSQSSCPGGDADKETNAFKSEPSKR